MFVWLWGAFVCDHWGWRSLFSSWSEIIRFAGDEPLTWFSGRFMDLRSNWLVYSSSWWCSVAVVWIWVCSGQRESPPASSKAAAMAAGGNWERWWWNFNFITHLPQFYKSTPKVSGFANQTLLEVSKTSRLNPFFLSLLKIVFILIFFNFKNSFNYFFIQK